MEIYLVKNLANTFSIAHNSDYEKAKKLKVGEQYKCKVTQPRNIKFHRKFFALMNLIYQNQDTYNNIDRLRKDLTIEAGFFENYTDFNGHYRSEAKSISFGKMKQDEFDTFYNRFLDTVVEVMEWDKQSIIDNVTNFY